MKITGLSTENFGALGTRSIEFSGKPVVFVGPNEKGKTSLVDAIVTALYGIPRGRGTGAHKRLFEARYGNKVKAGITISQNGNVILKSASDSPCGDGMLLYRVLRDMLIIRGGECAFDDPTAVSRHIAAKAFGRPAAILKSAAQSLNKATGRDGRSSFSRAMKTAADRLANNQRLASRAEELGMTEIRLAELERELAEREKEYQQADARHYELKIRLQSLRLSSLKEAETRLRTAKQDYDLLASFDPSPLQSTKNRLEGIEKSIAELNAEMKQIETENTADSAHLMRLEGEASGLMSQPKRAAILEAYAKWHQKNAMMEQLAEQSVSMPLAQRIILFIIAATGAAALAWGFFGPNPFMIIAAGILGLMLAFAGIKVISLSNPAFENAHKAAEDAEKEYQDTCSAMGVSHGDAFALASEAAERIMRLEQESALIRTRLEMRRSQHANCKDKLEEAEREKLSIASAMAEALRKFGAQDLPSLSAKAQAARERFEEVMAETRSAVSRQQASYEELRQGLSGAISQLERAIPYVQGPAAPEGYEDVSAQHEAAETAAKTAREAVRVARERIEGQKIAFARLKGELGAPAGEIMGRLEKEKAALADMARWQEAGQLAAAVIEKITASEVELSLKIADSAGPVLAALSGGKYNGMRIGGGGSLSLDNIYVRHSALGEKPAAWLSSGALDLAWLSLRTAIAGVQFPQPGFMILDEPFIALDAERQIQAAKGLFSGPLERWQIIALTKDETSARAFTAAGFERKEL